jgi:bacterioferritin (cytochrome b1)
MAEETMDVENQIECLNAAVRLQHRSVLHYSLVAGSVIGLEYQAHAEKMREHSLSELEDATRLVEKITALGGEPTTEVAPIEFVLRARRRPYPSPASSAAIASAADAYTRT